MPEVTVMRVSKKLKTEEPIHQMPLAKAKEYITLMNEYSTMSCWPFTYRIKKQRSK